MKISKTKSLTASLILGVFFSMLLAHSAVAHVTPGGRYIPDHYMDSACDYLYNSYESCSSGEEILCPGCTDTSDGCLAYLAGYYDAGCVDWCA